MTTTRSTTPTLVELPIGAVYPDPFQPRLTPDPDLADSLRSVGQLQPIRVERAEPLDAIDARTGKTFTEIAAESGYMIQDGERRWRGLLEAGIRTVLAVIVPPATEGGRLLRQLVANTGKPLTPIEEARAYKRLMDLEGWGINRLAQELGKPRSTVGDRVRALELDPVWLALMDSGLLQLSHAAILHPYAAVPAEYQQKAAAKLGEAYHCKQALERHEPIAGEDLERDVFGLYRDYLVRASDVRGYRGPVVEVKPNGYGTKAKYAADPALWRPIVKRHQKAEKAKRAASSSGHATTRSSDYYTSRASWIKTLPADVQQRSSSEYYPEPKTGETVLLKETGWALGNGADAFDPRYILAHVPPSQLIKIVGKYSVVLVTTDSASVDAARAALAERVDAAFAKKAAGAREQLRAALTTYAVTGPGAVGLATWLLTSEPPDGTPSTAADLAAVLELADPELLARVQQYQVDAKDLRALVIDMIARGTLDTFCAAVAAAAMTRIAVPSYDDIRSRVLDECRSVNPKWPGGGTKGTKGAKGAKAPRGAKAEAVAAADVAPIADAPSTDTLVCTGCGCTEDDACEGGCSWVSTDPALCSGCAVDADISAPVDAAVEEPSLEPLEDAFKEALGDPSEEVLEDALWDADA